MTNNTQLSIKQFINSQAIQQKFVEILGKNAASFTTSVLQVVNSNDLLKNADPQTVCSAAMMAATLNLPINNNLGFAYIVPFKNNKTNRIEAQFQIGYKGFIQLAQRTGKFERINACAIYSDDTEQDVYSRLTSLLPRPPSGQVTGYIAYFQLLNGYEAHLSMSLEELNAHANKYSQSAKKGFGVWKDNFDAMAQKTVIKLLLSKQAPLSIDMPLATAIQADQSVIVNGEYRYTDNEAQSSQGQLAVTDEQMPQILALTNQMTQEEIFGRYDLNFEQAQQVANAYQ